MNQKTTRKCLSCSDQFVPDRRNRQRQCHCHKPECRKASKAASQQRWLSKPENENYFRGSQNTARVRGWRQVNPGYWRKKTPCPCVAQQDRSNPQPPVVVDVVDSGPDNALQDATLTQPALLVGIISVLTGNTLQEDIAASVRSFLARGADILRMGHGSSLNPTNEKNCPVPAEAAACSPPI